MNKLKCPSGCPWVFDKRKRSINSTPGVLSYAASLAYAQVLSDNNVAICRRAAKLHVSFGERIVQLAEESSRTGMPVVRPMELVFPGQGFEKVRDQFMLGDEILVAPVVEKGKREREVVLPQGNWRADDGEVFVGETSVRIPVPLARLPYFQKL